MRVTFQPEWVAYYVLVARFIPGAWSTETGPARFPLELFRCLVCWGLTEREALEGHWNHHLRVGDVVR